MSGIVVGDAIPADGFSVITSDPPWPEQGGGKIKRGADKHYALMKPPQILEAMVRSEAWRPAKNCLHFMWTTMSSLPSGLWLMEGLGFRYVTHGVWVKTKADLAGGLDIGIGQYFRGAHELFLVGSRGSGFEVKTEDRSIPSVILAPAPREDGERIHSRKPPAFFAMIEKRTSGPKLEMFARKSWGPGWTAWGSLEHEPSGGDAIVDDDGEDEA